MVIDNDEALEAIAAYTAASEAALESSQRLNEAWRHYFESNGPEPSPEWIAEVDAQQRTNELALEFARRATMAVALSHEESATLAPVSSVVRTKRRRHRKNPFLTKIGRPGQRLLRGVLLTLLLLSLLVATGAGISLALEIAGFLHLIDDPVQLPVGIQLAIFVAAVGVVFGLRRLIKPVERALYGSKGVRPKSFSF